MSDSALIDDLERQFAENPRRVFARLANEYRKAGDAERAIDICLSHVPQQPGYISGHIVLGQALFDTGRYDEAKSAFETALGLDPENLIALRQLGDIARETGSSDDARSWYRRLLEVDPQNEEIAAQLEALDASAGAPPDVPVPDVAAAPELEPVSWGDIHPEGASAVPAPPAPEILSLEDVSGDAVPQDHVSPDVASHDVALEVEQAFPAMFATDPSAGTWNGDAHDNADDLEPVRLDGDGADANDGAIMRETEDSVVPPAGFEPTGIEVPEPLDLPDAPVADPSTEVPVVPASTPSWLATADYRDPAELGAEAVVAGTTGDVSATPAEVTPAEVTPADVVMSMPGPEAAAPPDAFVTETMADLYLQQGFTERALDVYLQLAAQYPDNPRFQEQIAVLRQAADSAPTEPGMSMDEPGGDGGWQGARPARTGPTIRAFLSAIAARRAGMPHSEWTPGSAPAGAVVEMGTEMDTEVTVAPYEEPPAAEAPPADVAAPQAPDTPDTEGMFPGWTVSSEDDAVGHALADAYADGSRGSDGRDGMPAHRAIDELSLDAVFRDAAGPEGSRQNGQSVSFDEFFADDDSHGSERSPDAASGDARGDAGATADLELFHAWLEGLKK